MINGCNKIREENSLFDTYLLELCNHKKDNTTRNVLLMLSSLTSQVGINKATMVKLNQIINTCLKSKGLLCHIIKSWIHKNS